MPIQPWGQQHILLYAVQTVCRYLRCRMSGICGSNSITPPRCLIRPYCQMNGQGAQGAAGCMYRVCAVLPVRAAFRPK